MILRPLEFSPAGDQSWHQAWPVVERLQRRSYESCWMITQTSHAALAGEIAERLQIPPVPKLDAALVRAIALHDAGWGMPDAQTIVQTRAKHPETPKSFLQIGVAEYLEAWSQSIETAQLVSPAGGYIVSRHFWRLAEHRVAHGGDAEADRKKLLAFVNREDQRQKRLASKQAGTREELEVLTDVLQFCDLLSLYICSGAQEKVEFPEYFGIAARIQADGENYRVDPRLVEPGSEFHLAALRCPAAKGESAKQIQIRIE